MIVNEWPYSHIEKENYIESRSVIGDTIIDKKSYFKISLINSKGRNHLFFERVDSTAGNLYRKDKWNDEILIDSLNSQLYDTSHASRHPEDFYNANCVCIQISDSVLFGEIRSFKSFFTEYSLDQTSHTLVDGIGLLRYWRSFDIGYEENKLIYAKIGDQTFGTPSSLNSENDQFNLEKEEPLFSFRAYPNPFNSVLILSIELSQISDLEINIYNVLGQKVFGKRRRTKDPGMHHEKFNFGKEPTGIYFLKIVASEQSVKKRVLYIK
jgi:hypothetical protein